ncbi:hypothetical protein FQN54_000670 [Arachnomyces sp. PD_36]|nr:hypothetical protein FQN54_000670 [Arachnomyces sp. PD_36]
MLNALANHGYLPHDGKGISKEMVVDVADSVLNWDAGVVVGQYDLALPANPDPNATTIDLDQLTKHNVLEHDGSLSRQDTYFGPADAFNEKAWKQTTQYFTGPTIDLAMASRARTARVTSSVATNPQFTFTDVAATFTYGETAAYQFVLGEWNLDAEQPKERILTPREMVDYFFVNERLPYELGWKTPENRLEMETFQGMVSTIQDITIRQMNEEEIPESQLIIEI